MCQHKSLWMILSVVLRPHLDLVHNGKHLQLHLIVTKELLMVMLVQQVQETEDNLMVWLLELKVEALNIYMFQCRMLGLVVRRILQGPPLLYVQMVDIHQAMYLTKVQVQTGPLYKVKDKDKVAVELLRRINILRKVILLKVILLKATFHKVMGVITLKARENTLATTVHPLCLFKMTLGCGNHLPKLEKLPVITA